MKLVSLPSKRDEEANQVQAEFARITEKLSVEAEHMSGFVVIVFDDFGNPAFSVYTGELFPIPPAMLPRISSDIVATEVYGKRRTV